MFPKVMLLLAATAFLLIGPSSANEELGQGKRAIDSLKLVVVVSRHGNRGGYKDYFGPEPENYTEFQPESVYMSPPVNVQDEEEEEDYPLDPYPLNDTKFWPYGPMQLTTVGRNIQFNLGKRVRKLYNGFLPSMFESSDIYACCDPVERVILSGQLVLAGLYPPVGFQKWHKDINWQPVPMYTNNKDHSEYLSTCPKYKAESKKMLSEFLNSEKESVDYLKNYVYNKTGQKVTAMDLLFMYDKILSEVNEGFNISSWTKDIFPYPLRTYFSKMFKAIYTGTDLIVKLTSGDLLKGIKRSMNEKVRGTLRPDRKIYYISSHDNTLMTLKIATGVPRSALPEVIHVGSAVVIELHFDTEAQKHYIKVLYLDGSTPDSDPQELALPTCGDPCWYPNFVNSTDPFTDINYDEECHRAYGESNALSRF